ncbi:MAG: signal peptidase II [Gammaproteobacteria bacterium]
MKDASGWRWLPLTVVVIVIDQVTKLLIVEHFNYGERLNLLPVLDLTLAYNTGAAWSFLAAESGWQRWMFSGLALAVAVVLVVWLKRLKARSQGLLACALSLILAGALGNVIDRIRLGHVIDFVLAYWDEHAFPIFNVADSAITVGAALLLLDALLETRRSKGRSEDRVKDTSATS